MWNRAVFWLTLWNICDIGFQKKAPMPRTMGTGAMVHSARTQFVQSRKPKTPKIVSVLSSRNGRPSTRNPQTRSVSLVTRAAIAPTCFLSKNVSWRNSIARYTADRRSAAIFPARNATNRPFTICRTELTARIRSQAPASFASSARSRWGFKT